MFELWTYPSRAQVVAYLECYAAHFNLRPVFHCAVQRVRRLGATWEVEAAHSIFNAPIVVVATGWADSPHLPQWPGMGVYRGELLHSSAYRNPAAFAEKRGWWWALAIPARADRTGSGRGKRRCDTGRRGPVKILPRDLLGLPLLTWAVDQAWIPPRLADLLNAPMIRLAVGSLRGTGLVDVRKGPRRMITEDHRVPLLTSARWHGSAMAPLPCAVALIISPPTA